MTDLVQSDVAPYVPPGRPVPRFVALIGLMVVLLIGLLVWGPFRARVDVEMFQWRVDGDRAIVAVALTNSGRFAIEVSELRSDGLLEPASFRVLVPEVDGDDLDAGEPLGVIRVEPDEAINVAVVFVPDCEQYPAGSGPGPSPEIEVTVALGLTRTVKLDDANSTFVAETICNPS